MNDPALDRMPSTMRRGVGWKAECLESSGPLGQNAALVFERSPHPEEVSHEIRPKLRQPPLLSSPLASGGRGYPSETQVRRGRRVVHGHKQLVEKLGRNDLCPCGSGRRFQTVLSALRSI